MRPTLLYRAINAIVEMPCYCALVCSFLAAAAVMVGFGEVPR